MLGESQGTGTRGSTAGRLDLLSVSERLGPRVCVWSWYPGSCPASLSVEVNVIQTLLHLHDVLL